MGQKKKLTIEEADAINKKNLALSLEEIRKQREAESNKNVEKEDL